MLRKKNIKVNDINAKGNETLKTGDIIKIFVSDETIDKFRKSPIVSNVDNKKYFEPDIIYEDSNLLIVNKPAGILSQKAQPDDYSINEICIDYLKKNTNTVDSNTGFKPSICNRLDRNTEGLIIFAKTYVAANEIAKCLRTRNMHKYYYCVVLGNVSEGIIIDGYLQKNEKNNKVKISKNENDGDYIQTRIIPIISKENCSLLEIQLITGKTHQIRAHLASIKHPILCDYKYGDKKANDYVKNKYGIDHQLLFSHKIVFPDFTENLIELSGKEISLDIPNIYKEIINGNME